MGKCCNITFNFQFCIVLHECTAFTVLVYKIAVLYVHVDKVVMLWHSHHGFLTSGYGLAAALRVGILCTVCC
jgi:hypothetical protein